MFCKKEFVQTVELSNENDTTVKFAENLEFTVPKLDKDGDCCYQLYNIKGDFEITKVERNGLCSKYPSECHKSNHRLKYAKGWILNHSFYITANVELEEMCVVDYQLFISCTRLKFLKWGKFIKSEIVLPGYDDIKFTYYVKKINGTRKNDIEIHIKNPYAEAEIQGKQGDYKCEQSSTKDVDLLLSFGFDPNNLIKTSTPATAGENNEKDVTVNTEDQASIFEPSLEQNRPIQASTVDESRPESVIQTELSTTTSIGTKLLQTIGSNHLFADVFFITSDGTTIPSHRNILASSSNILLQIFKESTKIPVQIDADGFDADTIESALSFLYDKPDAINGKEMVVFQFAVKYGIQDLIDACCSYFEKSVDSSNVCEFIQIAYFNNFEKLKQKRLKVMVEKKSEIDPTQKLALPKNILFDAYCL